MNLDVSVNGCTRRVAIEPGERPGHVTVVVNGHRRVVDASWIDADTLSLIDGAVAREIRIHRLDGGAIGIAIDGKMFEAVVSKGGRAHAPESLSGRQVVKAPMPGRIARVLVAVGDRVTERQGVVVVEAMKMENELRSPIAGTIREIAVVEGAAVHAGTVLVVVE